MSEDATQDELVEEEAPASSEVREEAVEYERVNRTRLERAMRLDPHRRTGGTTPGSEADVMVVTRALVREGLLGFEGDGAFDRTAHRALQKYGSLEELAEKHHIIFEE